MSILMVPSYHTGQPAGSPWIGPPAAETERNPKREVITNTVAVPAEKRIDKIRVLSVAPLFGEAIKRIHSGESISSLFV
jgi:ribose-phosphate pyrophosphokinase